MIRDIKGQFIHGTTNETIEEKEKRIFALRKAQRKSPRYLGDKKFSPLYNVWRSFMFTKKGKKVGYSVEWSKFINFFNDMNMSFEKGLRLGRLSKDKPFSKENCIWMTNQELSNTTSRITILTYKGKTKTLKEWSLIYAVPYNALKQRFIRGKNYTPHEIIFGKHIKQKGDIKDIKELSIQKQKDKISKMLSAYRCSDKKRNRVCDYSKEWLLKEIITKNCTYCKSSKNVGCDRIDNSKGHTMDNTIPACYTCNCLRQNEFSVEEMKLIGKLVKKIKESRV